MKITLKTLGNTKHDFEDVSPSTTIKELMELVAADDRFGGGTVRKLIFKGKSLKKMEQTLGECNVEEGSEIVCLVKKQKKGTSASPPPAETDEKDASSEAPKDRNNYTINPADLQKLCKMGFPHQLAELSLKAAYGDAALAAQYLMAGGIPAERAQALHKEMMQLQQLSLQQQRARGPQGMNAQFENMLANPQQMAMILSNPAVQNECLRMLNHINPELFQRFSADPDTVGEEEEFQKAMFNILRKSFNAQPAAPQVRKIELTDQDRANLKRLMEEKAVPDMQKAATIYMKFGKDIDKAMAFCDEVLAQARAMHPEAAKADAEKDAADKARRDAARQPLQARNRSHSDEMQQGGPSSPNSGGCRAQPQDTVVSIPLNMLAEDDDSDEE